MSRSFNVILNQIQDSNFFFHFLLFIVRLFVFKGEKNRKAQIPVGDFEQYTFFFQVYFVSAKSKKDKHSNLNTVYFKIDGKGNRLRSKFFPSKYTCLKQRSDSLIRSYFSLVRMRFLTRSLPSLCSSLTRNIISNRDRIVGMKSMFSSPLVSSQRPKTELAAASTEHREFRVVVMPAWK